MILEDHATITMFDKWFDDVDVIGIKVDPQNIKTNHEIYHRRLSCLDDSNRESSIFDRNF